MMARDRAEELIAVSVRTFVTGRRRKDEKLYDFIDRQPEG